MVLWNEYFTPTSLPHALELLQRYAGHAQIVAGGTDLILDMQHNGHPPAEALVDVTHIAGLAEITEQDGWIVVGAAVTHAQIERSPLIRRSAACLVESCGVVGGPQVRNVATLGGNIAHALPAADGSIGLLALNAEVEVSALVEGEISRTWRPLLSLFAGPGRNTLEPGQLLSAFRFRPDSPRQASAFDRIMRPQGVALPILGVAVRLTLDAGRTRVADAVIAVGPAGPIPFRAAAAEEMLVAAPRFDGAAVAAAVAAAQRQARLRTSKHRASAGYRQEMVAVLLQRVLPTAFARAQAAG